MTPGLKPFTILSGLCSYRFYPNLFPSQTNVISTNKQQECPLYRVLVLWIASCTLLEPGPFLGLEVLEGYFTGWTEILACALYVSKRMIFCSSLMLIAPEIFFKIMFHSLTYKCQLTNNNWHNLCFHSPYFRDFDLKVFVFRDLFSDLCRAVLVGWYWHIGRLATSVAVVLDHYLYQACSLTTLYPYVSLYSKRL